jgi:hypothetical protein
MPELTRLLVATKRDRPDPMRDRLQRGADEMAVLLAVPIVSDTLRSSLAGRERAVALHDLTPSQDATSERAAFARFAQS